jgi:DNA-binding NtrC family response regulator
MCNGKEILPAHLPDFLRENNEISKTRKAHENDSITTDRPLEGWNLAVREKEAITGALQEAQGNRTTAAALLGISRRTLQRKILELSL